MDWKKIGKKLLFPPMWLILILVVITAITVPIILIRGWSESPVAYALYVVAFYTVCVVSTFCGLVLPKQFKQIKQKIYANPFGNRYMTDAAFKTHVWLYVSLGANLLYVGINILSFALYRSFWFLVLAGYYVILAIMRFLLVRYVRKAGIGKDRLGELKSARLCSCILLTVNFVLSGAVLMMLYQNKGFEYHGILIYVMAMYTFYITANAIRNLIRYRKYNSPIMTTTTIVTFSAALVSMLSLETAMFSEFGQEMSPENQYLMIALTGAGVSIAVITMSVYMIVQTEKEMKKLKE